MQAAGELAQLGGRLAELARRLLEQLLRRRGVGVELLAREPQVERQRDQPLLGAVVEVALEAAALVVGGLDDPRPRRAQLLDPGAQLDVQALVLEREAAAAPTAAISSGSVSSVASWQIIATGRPSCSTGVRAVSPSRAGNSTGWPSAST